MFHMEKRSRNTLVIIIIIVVVVVVVGCGCLLACLLAYRPTTGLCISGTDLLPH